MDFMRGQGSIQMLLTAEQEAQQIVAAARNVKMARLWQAKEEAKLEVENHRSHLEYQYQRDIFEESGETSDSTIKRLEAQTEAKIQSLNESASKVSPEIVKMLLKYITTARTWHGEIISRKERNNANIYDL